MAEYKYCVYDDEHKIPDKCFNNFEDAFDYAQSGLVTFIEEVPYVNEISDDDDEATIVWSWDDTWNRDEAIERVAQLHNPSHSQILEDVEVEVKASNPEEFAEFARCMLGDNIGFFEANFDDQKLTAKLPDVELEDDVSVDDLEEDWEDNIRLIDNEDELNEATVWDKVKRKFNTATAQFGFISKAMDAVYQSFIVVPYDKDKNIIKNKAVKNIEKWKNAAAKAKDLSTQYVYAQVIGQDTTDEFEGTKWNSETIQNLKLQSYRKGNLISDKTKNIVALYARHTEEFGDEFDSDMEYEKKKEEPTETNQPKPEETPQAPQKPNEPKETPQAQEKPVEQTTSKPSEAGSTNDEQKSDDANTATTTEDDVTNSDAPKINDEDSKFGNGGKPDDSSNNEVKSKEDIKREQYRKILSVFRDQGLPVEKFFTKETVKDESGKDVVKFKPTDDLIKINKELFGESLREDLSDDEFYEALGTALRRSRKNYKKF